MIAGSFKRLRYVIESLAKNVDRKTDKDLENLKPILELFPEHNTLDGLPLNQADLKTLAKYAKYVRVEPGEVLREHGEFRDPQKDGYHIILKG